MNVIYAMNVKFTTLLLGMVAAVVVGYLVGYFLRKMFAEYQIRESKEKASKLVQDANKEVQNRLKAADIEAKEKHLLAKSKLEAEMENKRSELRKQELGFQKKEGRSQAVL